MTQKVAVITGSHKGLGYAIARQLAQQENIQVVLTSRQEQDGLAAQQRLSISSVVSPIQSRVEWLDGALGKGTSGKQYFGECLLSGLDANRHGWLKCAVHSR